MAYTPKRFENVQSKNGTKKKSSATFSKLDDLHTTKHCPEGKQQKVKKSNKSI